MDLLFSLQLVIPEPAIRLFVLHGYNLVAWAHIVGGFGIILIPLSLLVFGGLSSTPLTGVGHPTTPPFWPFGIGICIGAILYFLHLYIIPIVAVLALIFLLIIAIRYRDSIVEKRDQLLFQIRGEDINNTLFDRYSKVK